MDTTHDTAATQLVCNEVTQTTTTTTFRLYSVAGSATGGPGLSVAAKSFPSPVKPAAPSVVINKPSPAQPPSSPDPPPPANPVSSLSATQPEALPEATALKSVPDSKQYQTFDIIRLTSETRGKSVPAHLLYTGSSSTGWYKSGSSTRISRYVTDFSPEAVYTLVRMHEELRRLVVVQGGSVAELGTPVVPGLKEVSAFAGKWPYPGTDADLFRDFKRRIIACGLTQACVHRCLTFLLTLNAKDNIFSFKEDLDRWHSGEFRRPFGKLLPSPVFERHWDAFVKDHWPGRDVIGNLIKTFHPRFSKVVESRKSGDVIRLRCREDDARGSFELEIKASEWRECVNSADEWRSIEACASLCVLTPRVCRMSASMYSEGPDAFDADETDVYVWLTRPMLSSNESAMNNSLKNGEESKKFAPTPRVFVADPDFVWAMRDEVKRAWNSGDTIPLIRSDLSGSKPAYSLDRKALHFLASLYSESRDYLRTLFTDYFVPIFSSPHVNVSALASPDWSSFLRSGMDELLPLCVCLACGYSEFEFLHK